MYGENQNFQNGFHDTAGYYGAAPDINPADNSSRKGKRKGKVSSFSEKKLFDSCQRGSVRACGFFGIYRSS